MIARALLAGLLAAACAVPGLAEDARTAQLGQSLTPRNPSTANRPSVDASLRSTVTLVLRAVARSAGLPPALSDPEPLPEERLAELRVGARLSPDFPAEALPAAINDRLPHARGGSVWVAAGTWLVEIDPVRLLVVTVAPDVLPPDLGPRR